MSTTRDSDEENKFLEETQGLDATSPEYIDADIDGASAQGCKDQECGLGYNEQCYYATLMMNGNIPLFKMGAMRDEEKQIS